MVYNIKEEPATIPKEVWDEIPKRDKQGIYVKDNGETVIISYNELKGGEKYGQRTPSSGTSISRPNSGMARKAETYRHDTMESDGLRGSEGSAGGDGQRTVRGIPESEVQGKTPELKRESYLDELKQSAEFINKTDEKGFQDRRYREQTKELTEEEIRKTASAMRVGGFSCC